MNSLKRSPLHDVHVSLGARMVPFAGWEMPVQYEGIIPENKAVRSSLGIFDISHMGQLAVYGDSGSTVTAWLNELLTANAVSLSDGQGQYTLLLNPAGGVIDDLIIYRESENSYFLVVNASKTDEDFAWLQSHLPDAGIRIDNRSSSYAAMAVQGPMTAEVFPQIFGKQTAIPDRFCMESVSTSVGPVIVCRTGYTGEDGF
ncbi:MAG: glycine cleavage system protein T, partial [Planctomycetaceae bacterium]|nr:glycine cleavage system protein T [Planctomycetaceae bacterium]